MITTGQQVRFPDDRRWWTVRATDDRYAILTRPEPFKPRGSAPLYTILDTSEHRRGPCNLTGQGWDCTTDQGCHDLLHALQTDDVEISHRNNVPATHWDTRAGKAA